MKSGSSFGMTGRGGSGKRCNHFGAQHRITSKPFPDFTGSRSGVIFAPDPIEVRKNEAAKENPYTLYDGLPQLRVIIVGRQHLSLYFPDSLQWLKKIHSLRLFVIEGIQERHERCLHC